jgi:hypothetical protein
MQSSFYKFSYNILITRQVLILFSTLELSVYRIQDRQKLFSLKLTLPSTYSNCIFPVSHSKTLLFGTSKVNLLLLDLETTSLTDFAIPFTNTKILKILQIHTKENNFVFLNDYNQILFCKFIRDKTSTQNPISDNENGNFLFIFLKNQETSHSKPKNYKKWSSI